MKRITPSPALLRDGIVAVLRADDARRYGPAAEILTEEGIRSIELTLTTPGTLDALEQIAAAIPDADVGVGTVLHPEDALRAIDAGARFLVTPNTGTAVIEAAMHRGVATYAGALTPSEAFTNWEAGAAAVKIFPAATVGPQYVSHLRGPFPGMLVMPSGGVALGDIPAWINAGAIAVSLGGPLLGDSLKGGDTNSLRQRARAAVAAVTGARAAS